MFGLFIIAVIVIAMVQRSRYGRARRRGSQDVRWQRRADRWGDKDQWARWAEDFKRQVERQAGKEHWAKWAEDFKRHGEHIAERAQQRAQRAASQAERHAQKFERKARRWSGTASAIGEAIGKNTDSNETRAKNEAPNQFKSDADRSAYDRARRQAAREAGFYAHLMWYGLVIGFLFLINLMTTSYPWFLWPALGWGFGLASHFSAVYGWSWIQKRIFEPAIERELTEEKEVLRTEKQASLDELTATFAHEIRNPIAAAKSLVQQMGEDPTSGENVEYAKVALDELARVERSVAHLLKYAKEEDYHFENVNLALVLDSALTQMRAKLEGAAVIVSRNYLSGPTVRADADKLRQVFSNIIDNAIDAMSERTTDRRLEVGIQAGRGPRFAFVRMRDNGCGIPEDKIGKIFNPFYTSKATGTGLGMAVAKKIIEAHGGTIEVQSQVGFGTEFAMSVPLADARRVSPSDAADESAPDRDAEPIVAPANVNGSTVAAAASGATATPASAPATMTMSEERR